MVAAVAMKSGTDMSLLTELGCGFDFCVYKYSAPTELCAFLVFQNE